MTDLYYFRTCPRENLSDPALSRMDLEERGAHTILTEHAWVMDGLPNDRRDLARLIRLEPGSERAERILTRVIDLAWKPDADDPRLLRNDYQEAQRQEAEAAYRKQCERVAKARKSNPKNQTKPEQWSKPELTSDQTSDQTSELKSYQQFSNSVIQETTNKQRVSRKPILHEDRFEEYWSDHRPRRPNDSKADARAAWHARMREGTPPDAIIRGAQAYKAWLIREGTDPKYIKQAATFLGPGRHWETDYGPAELPVPEPYLPNGELNPAFVKAIGMAMPAA